MKIIYVKDEYEKVLLQIFQNILLFNGYSYHLFSLIFFSNYVKIDIWQQTISCTSVRHGSGQTSGRVGSGRVTIWPGRVGSGHKKSFNLGSGRVKSQKVYEFRTSHKKSSNFRWANHFFISNTDRICINLLRELSMSEKTHFQCNKKSTKKPLLSTFRSRF